MALTKRQTTFPLHNQSHQKHFFSPAPSIFLEKLFFDCWVFRLLGVPQGHERCADQERKVGFVWLSQEMLLLLGQYRLFAFMHSRKTFLHPVFELRLQLPTAVRSPATPIGILMDPLII